MLALIVAASLIQAPSELYRLQPNDIDSKPHPLSRYQGKVLLIVNVASYCGNTKQYAPLETMYRKYKGQGFVVLGFPANDFNNQEPGSEAEIKAFCSEKFDVTFPMFSKVKVTGDGKHPLYQWLVSKTEDKKDVEWNFGKFLVNRDGTKVQRFRARTSPDSDEVVAAIEAALRG